MQMSFYGYQLMVYLGVIVIMQSGGPSYAVELGRLDGLRSTSASVNGKLPQPTFNLDKLNSLFAAKGLSQTDMIALSGICFCNNSPITLSHFFFFVLWAGVVRDRVAEHHHTHYGPSTERVLCFNCSGPHPWILPLQQVRQQDIQFQPWKSSGSHARQDVCGPASIDVPQECGPKDSH